MPAAVADTGPIQYLFLIDQIDLLRRFYGQIHIPTQVRAELTDLGTPKRLKTWIESKPEWIAVHQEIKIEPDLEARVIDDGEKYAIALAQQLELDVLVCDETKGRALARSIGLLPIGTLGVLQEADRRGWLDFPEQMELLRSTTNFRLKDIHAEAILEDYRQERERRQRPRR